MNTAIFVAYAPQLVAIFVAYAPTSTAKKSRKDMDLKRLYREDHTFFKVIAGDFNAKIDSRGTAEEVYVGTHGMEWHEQCESLSQFIMLTHIT
ncbi:unnamed protein product [Haemonchus placei]|uniref:Endo/exonuclease/phosphatase domain-containing protein n=1 Tax=Haemonchus placei TaxID=6290 RepID=A0A0N4WNG0_HAEPC|nr:unnamed protein product [Haemonchus placei]